MNSEVTKSNAVAASTKIKTIPQILHQGIICQTSINSLAGTMDFIRKKRKIKFNTDSRLSCGVSLLLELLTFISIVLYRWIHVHFMKKSQTFFVYVWMENLIIVGIAQLLFKIFNLPKHTFMKSFQYLCPLLVLNGIVVVIQGYDFLYFTRKSGGSEFYQFSFVLSIPVVLAIMNVICTFNSPWHISSIVGICTIMKVTFLLQDREFVLSFGLCVGTIVFEVIHVCYLICLKADLQKYTALELIYSLSWMTLLLLPPFIIEQGGISGTNFKLVMVSVLSGTLKLCTLYFMFVLLKHTDPVKTLVIVNAAFIPDHFMQALVYKLDCHISTCKICFLMIVDFFVGHFKRNVENTTSGNQDDRVRYSLMR